MGAVTGFAYGGPVRMQAGGALGNIQSSVANNPLTLSPIGALLQATGGMNNAFSYTPAGAILDATGNTDKFNAGLGNVAGNFGMGSGAAGTNFAGPTTNNPNITSPLAPGQLGQANQNGINSVQAQNDLLAALRAQQGLAAQNQVLGSQQGLSSQLGQAGGLNAQTQAIQGLQGVAQQQLGTANQLQGIANGTGPNPAQAALNQETGANVANQAALMAGQRGAGANVGLLARQAGQQGAGIQQQAVGQSATLQAQQQLAALQQMQAQQQAQAATQGQIGAQGQALTAAQQQALALQGGTANTIAGQQIGGTTAASQVAQNEQAQQLGAQGAFNTVQGGLQQNVNTNNAGLVKSQLDTQGKLIGNVANTISSALMGADGGEIPSMSSQPVGPTSHFAQFLNKRQMPGYSGGGHVHDLEKGGAVIPHSADEKARVRGNSYSNDTIPALLSAGEVVIPRSVMQSSDPVRNSALFVAKTLAKRGRKHG